MDFEWDPDKETSNLAKHGISFAQAIAVFDDEFHIELDSTKPEYGEIRSKAIGLIGPYLFALIYTRRGVSIRVISVRRARDDERRAYDQGKATS